MAAFVGLQVEGAFSGARVFRVAAEFEQPGHLIANHEGSAVGGGKDHLQLFRGDVFDQEAVWFLGLWSVAPFFGWECLPCLQASSVVAPNCGVLLSQRDECPIFDCGLALAAVGDRHHPDDGRH